MAALSTYLDNKLIDHRRGVAAYTMPTVYMALTTAASSPSGAGTEAAYTGYARVPLAGLLGAASAGSGANTSPITFGTNTGGSTSNVVGFATFDALTGGNMLEYGTCTLTVSTGIAPSFANGTWTATQT